MAGASTKKTFKSGDIIMRQGDVGENAYIIESGKVEIFIDLPNGTAKPIATRGPGAMIGEMAIVDHAPRTATVKALEDCHLLEINREDFARRLENADPILRMTIQVILARYRDSLTRAEIEGQGPSVEDLERKFAAETDAVEKIKIANEFSTALQDNQLSLHYQPIVDLRDGHIAGFEALMRWNHPELGAIPPSTFIPIAEETGLIIEASEWALGEACKALKRIGNRTGHPRDLFMSVNFSSHDFARDGFAKIAYDIISRSDVDPRQIHLEITERLLMAHPDNARETLQLCKKSGMDISIDDFGTGYSSLSYLHYFPIGTLKIDQKFVREMLKKDNAMALIKSIIALGKNMGMKIIAEGVEEPEETQALRELECDYGQGYVFAKPMPELELTKLISECQGIIEL